MRFVAVDVETANPNMASICQVGLVLFEDGEERRCESILIDPQDWFCPLNVRIHGIDDQVVAGAPVFARIHDRLCDWTAGEIVVCHTHFDRVALAQACAGSGLQSLGCTWLDSAKVTRRTWPDLAQNGYGLGNVARRLGIEFRHHDALEDARACGHILMHAIAETGHDVASWLRLVTKPITVSESIRRQGDGDGGLAGEVIVFTGALEVPRRIAADMAARAGADVEPGVTKKTTLLVVGDQDIARLNGADKSSKHRKAEDLIAGGAPLRIVGESDFAALAAIIE